MVGWKIKLAGFGLGALLVLFGVGFGTKKLDDWNTRMINKFVAQTLVESREIIAELKWDKEAYVNFNKLFNKELNEYGLFLKLNTKEIATVRFFCESFVMIPEEFFAYLYRGHSINIPIDELKELSLKNPDRVDFYVGYKSINSKVRKLPMKVLEKLRYISCWRPIPDKGKRFLEIMKKASGINGQLDNKTMLLQSRRMQDVKTKVAFKKQRITELDLKARVRNLKPRLRA